jgi:MFS family permease
MTQAYPSKSRAWTLVLILCLASVVSTIDRGIFTLVVDPVRHTLKISDIQISLLQGLSFGIFYATVGVPLGLVADRVRRRNLVILGLLVWSAATVLGGLAPNYFWMFVSRLLVGLGEATLGPCAVSMIADMFPSSRRGRPTSIYLLGQAVSGGLAVMFVGQVLSISAAGGFKALPGAQGLEGWRMDFVTAGLLGLLVAALLITQREPERRGVALPKTGGLSAGAALRYFAENWRVFVPYYLGFAFMSLAAYGMIGWNAVLLMRRFGMSPTQVGHWLGLASVVAGAVGSLLAGQIFDHLGRTGRRTSRLATLAILPLCALPATMAVFAPNGAVALIVMSIMTMVWPMIGVSMLSSVQEMTPNNMRGVAVALFGLVNTLVGAVAGPLLIATATEHLFKSPASVGYSILTVAAPAMLIASALYFAGLRALGASLRRPSTLVEVMNAEA